ncbi:MAG: PLP-dependent transferase [bacterium]|nr:PLP-dependent transferase [bacterium]
MKTRKALKRKPYDPRKDKYGSVARPINYRGYETYVSTTYCAPNAETLAKQFAGILLGPIYMGMGIGNPTVRKFEGEMVLTETDDPDRYDAYACATGSSALHLLIEHLLAKKKLPDGTYETTRSNVVSSPYIYGGTHYFLTTYLPGLGMECRFVSDPADPKSWEAAITPETKFFLCETSTNPHGKVSNIPMIAEVAHRHGKPLVADNTIPTGALCRPLLLGADIVVSSATKGICGYSTAGAGVIIGEAPFIKQFRASVQCVRPVLDPRAAVDMMIGLSDLGPRMKRHSENALTLATMLAAHPFVGNVSYAYLPNHLEHALAKSQMKGGGPLFSFTVNRFRKITQIEQAYAPRGVASAPATLEESQRFINMLTKKGPVLLAVHIAHKTTLATHPASTSHAKVPKPDREEMGLTDNMIRISVGSESPRAFLKVVKQFKKTLDEWAKTLV